MQAGNYITAYYQVVSDQSANCNGDSSMIPLWPLRCTAAKRSLKHFSKL